MTTPLPTDWATVLHDDIRACLRDELDAWFPACLDRQGFRLLGRPPGEEATKTVVYEARLTWTAAAVCQERPAARDRFLPVVRHGIAFLQDAFWDRTHGGVFWETCRTGEGVWQGHGVKHLYGLSFALYAAAAAHRATGDHAALDLADGLFDWLERHGRDGDDPGYPEVFERDGTPSVRTADDVLGTRPGCRSMNATIHALEAVAAYARVRPLTAARLRLDALLSLVRDRLVSDDGVMALQFGPGWTPEPGPTSWGHNLETAFLLLEADQVMAGRATDRTLRRARLLVDTALQYGWDAATGGFHEQGTRAGPTAGVRQEWWSAAEGLNALVLMDHHFGGDTDVYRRRAVCLWAFIRTAFLVGDGTWWFHADPARPTGTRWQPSVWQATYHTVRAQLHLLRLLCAPRPGGG